MKLTTQYRFKRSPLYAALTWGLAVVLGALLVSCGGHKPADAGFSSSSSSSSSSSGKSSSSSSSSSSNSSSSSSSSGGELSVIDIKDEIFTNVSGDCADYQAKFAASVQDIQRMLAFDESVVITAGTTTCTLASNNIPNHDFNDASAHFANNVAAKSKTYTIPRKPVRAASTTALTQNTYNAVMLNGVVLDILSAGCYRPSSASADADGNVAVGCSSATETWLLDPLSEYSRFSTDIHHAHTQPDGLYHYHGNPMAMFDDNPGPNGSPVIGFAADGFPIYGSYFLDKNSGKIRKALSSYTLKAGTRPSSANDPGGVYNGLYVADYEYTRAGDLDECNGMTVNGQYGYYVTDSYPWVIKCFVGTPNSSFKK